ncbi:ABC transporter substrate-binding protein/permease [Lacticaseibacillus pantheris]|jgi:polar amino acid transport system substrate-binding protein|uniref:Amino acid ABC transporter permease n=1 Tax=Lacticaseibacillus pantheris DSM 15945 = JCM 12539 = NBRC 106106 TaxID=1423783 RepID=A0A0R1U2P9_9LACO|nr:ABC transporter substrate-binding protein/permease [Lacticaseibacillus pantheris]KRL85539.1 amino acid ABC transporter permease [Lacticaseibacillus pantheris DSM 15945 = JCM 12539 = NBRC 106106]
MKKLTHVLLALIISIITVVGLTGGHSVHAATDTSLQKVEDKGYIVMGTSPDYPPYEFLSKNKVVGMDVEVGKRIAQDLGVKLKVKQMDFDQLLVALETGKVDMVISGMSPTSERAKHVDFSKVYYKGGQNIIVNKADAKLYAKGKSSLTGKKVGAQTGSLQQTLAKKQIKNSQVTGLAKTTDLLLDLKSHKVDAVVLEKPVADAYAANDASLTSIDGHFDLGSDMQGTAIGFAKGSDALVNKVNKTIDKINKGNLTDGYLKTAATYMKTNTKNTSMLAYWKVFGKGVWYTIFISLVAVVFGVLGGIIFALMRLSKSKVLHGIAVAYIEFIRGTPLMIQVMFVYFGIGMVVSIPALVSGIIAVAINSSAYVAEIFRSGINSIPVGQTEAARSLGLSQRETMQSVVLPQALKNIWPALGNEFVSLIKESSIVSIIGVTDLIYQLKVVQTDTYKGVAPIAVAMVLYFIMTFTLSKILNHFEGKMKHEG